MQNLTKGALASITGGVLLLGGAGTLAYWNDAVAVPGVDLESGHLRLVTDVINTGCGGWELDGGAPYAPGDQLVPGDVVTVTCAFTVDAEGNHLVADVQAATPNMTTDAGSTDGSVSVAVADLEVNGSPVTQITSADDGRALLAHIAITFAGSADNDTQGFEATLADLTLTATQIHA